MSGDLITGDELLSMWIANHVVPPEDVMEKSMERAQAMAALPPYALRATKNVINKMIKQQAELVLDIGLAWEFLSMRQNDHKEAATAWVEQREGVYTGPSRRRRSRAGFSPPRRCFPNPRRCVRRRSERW